MTLLELLWTFFYIGLFTIGGGQVAITLMYEPLVGGGIISGEQFYNMVRQCGLSGRGFQTPAVHR